MLTFFPHLLALLWLVSGNAAQQFFNCDYNQEIVAGKKYNIFNKNYPQPYPAGSSCRWFARSDRRINITCDPFELPASARCAQDSLTLFDGSDPVGHRYCGKGAFNFVTQGNQLIIALTTSIFSQGGRFLCTIETVAPEPEKPCRCGWKNPSRIVGGKETGVNEYPMMVGLVDTGSRMVFCGATIINNLQVLTAAHCVANRDITTVGILVGDHDLTTGSDTNATKLFRVNLVRIHPLYNESTQDNDIALIDIRGTITFSQQVGPVCLPFQHASDSFAGNFVQVLGWGSTEFAGAPSSVLMEATVSVITNAQCRTTYPQLTNTEICTYADGKDSCQFDSGGPVLWLNPTTRRLISVGITSYGGACGLGDAAVNTKVGAFVNWIQLNTLPGMEYCYQE